MAELSASDYAPSLDMLALGYRDGTFEVRSPAPRHLLSRGKHASAIAKLSLSRDGTRLASIDRLGTLAISELESGALGVLDDDQRLRSASGTQVGLAWDPASHVIAVAVGNHLRVLDVGRNDGHELVLDEAATALAFTPDGTHLVAAGRQLRFLSLPELKPKRTVAVPLANRETRVTDLRFSPDGQRLGVLLTGGAALVDVASDQVEASYFSELNPIGLRFASDGRLLIFGRRALYVGAASLTSVEGSTHQLQGELSDVQFRKDGSLLFLGDAEDVELATLLE
jgi:WD40 repeat protein